MGWINKKGQGLSLNVIIIAALVLIVLVVLVVVFSNRIGKWGDGLNDQTKDIGKQCEVPGTTRECVNSLGDCSGDVVRGEFVDCQEEFGDDHACCEF